MKETKTTTSDSGVHHHWSLRRRVVGQVLRLLLGRPPKRAKLKPHELRRILLIRNDRLGDYVITTPIIETIQRIAPEAEIDVLGSPYNAEIIQSDPRIHSLILWGYTLRSKLAAIRECRKRDHDITFQLVTRHTTLPIIVAGICTPRGRVVGRGHTYNRWLFDHRLTHYPSSHLALQTFDIFLEGIDLEGKQVTMPPYALHLHNELKNSTKKELEEEGLKEKEFILLNLSASEEYRTLRSERAIQLATQLREQYASSGLAVAVTGAPGDHDKIQSVAEQSGAKAMMFPSILKAVAGIDLARLLISPDTGSVHIASAVGTPVVAYYSESLKPKMWAPLQVPHQIVVGNEERATDSIRLEEILIGVDHLLEDS